MENCSFINSAVIAVKEHNLTKLKIVANTIPTEKVSEALSRGDINGDTPLNQALDNNDVPILKFLLQDCHVNPSVRDGKSRFPLTIAASKSEIEIVEMLIESGAILNFFVEEDYKMSPLYQSCQSGHWEIARFLIEKGASIDKSKCLITAYNFNNVEFIKYLLKCGGDVNVRDENGKTLLHLCCLFGNVEILQIIVKKEVYHDRIWVGLTPLQLAALRRHDDIINFYFDNNYCTRDEICDCFELLGVSSIERKDVTSAINFWNKASCERSEKIDFTSSFLSTYQRNMQHADNYKYLSDDLEKAAIHSIIILERLFGIRHVQFKENIGALTGLISIMKIDFWKLLLNLVSDQRIYNIFYPILFYFKEKFENYIKSLYFRNLNSSIVKVFCEFMNVSLNMRFVKSEQCFDSYNYTMLIQGFVDLYSIKENCADFDTEWFHTIIRNGLNPKTLAFGSLFHAFLTIDSFWELPKRIVYETFEYCCKLSESVDCLNGLNQTPLHSALRYAKHDEYVDILLKYGAVINTRDILGESIRERCKKVGRDDICVGPSALQILVNAKLLLQGKQEENIDIPAILKNFMRLH